MKRASTPFCMFLLPKDPDYYDSIIVTYSQRGEILLQKTKEDMRIGVVKSKEIYSVYYNLTQEETNLFDYKYVLLVQVRAFKDGYECYSSSVHKVKVEDVLNDEVMTQ